MNRQRSYGDMLRTARERKGLELSTVASRLRIRTDIVRAIEEADFAKMPPRGYSRNMISSYARLLGLSPSEVTNRYLDEIELYETGRARMGSSRDAGQTGSMRRSRGEASRGSRSGSARSTREYDAQAGGRGERDRSRSTQARGTQPRNERRTRAAALPEGSVGSGIRRQNMVGGNSYPSAYAQSQGRSGFSAASGGSKPWPFIIGGIVVVLLVIALLVVFFGGDKTDDADLPDVPISGLTDTSSPEDDQVAQAQTQPPTSAKVEYRIADQKIYTEITTDGNTVKDMMQGPLTETVEVTGKWVFATWVTDAVTITVDGEPVSFQGTNAEGIPICTVDFSAILAKWHEDNPSYAASSSASSASSATSSGSQAKSSGSSSASTN